MSDTTTNNAGTWRERLTELLASQRQSVTQLNELSAKQGEHIREGRSGPLLALLTRRQQLIEQFLSTHEQMQSLLADVGSEIEQLGSEDRAAIRATIDEINSLLGEVLERDETDRRALEAARGEVKNQMRSMSSGRQARRAYLGGRDAGANNRFADQQG